MVDPKKIQDLEKLHPEPRIEKILEFLKETRDKALRQSLVNALEKAKKELLLMREWTPLGGGIEETLTERRIVDLDNERRDTELTPMVQDNLEVAVKREEVIAEPRGEKGEQDLYSLGKSGTYESLYGGKKEDVYQKTGLGPEAPEFGGMDDRPKAESERHKKQSDKYLTGGK